jgi:hypothetical protein
MEDLERYLNDVVEPTIKDFKNNPTSVRHAFLACVAVFHSVDYLAYPRKSRSVRQKFRRESREFMLVDQVAHAFKHVIAGDPSKPNLAADEVISRPPAKWDEMVWDLSRWDDPDGGVTLDKDRNIDLFDVVRGATEFLRKQVQSV